MFTLLNILSKGRSSSWCCLICTSMIQWLDSILYVDSLPRTKLLQSYSEALFSFCRNPSSSQEDGCCSLERKQFLLRDEVTRLPMLWEAALWPDNHDISKGMNADQATHSKDLFCGISMSELLSLLAVEAYVLFGLYFLPCFCDSAEFGISWSSMFYVYWKLYFSTFQMQKPRGWKQNTFNCF
jgi:hypothetical protein